ncbi:leucine-rich repeat transmembrane neuronal protein 2-like, partial [Anneissia japonica]|uniref:leucine-rich repeat transmembrane neuronal protein 2-like n=1 Tax=Anneissia japonica TaxID=1529436 RepID=UPI0014256311
LKKLYLGNNSLLTIPNEAFAGTTSLTTLDLSRNSLTHIGVELFENLPNLKTLRIDHNPNLKAFPVTVLDFISLDTLILSGNTFNCNCQSDVIKLSNIFKNASSTWKPPKCANTMDFTALESECRHTNISVTESQTLSNKPEKTTNHERSTKQEYDTTNQLGVTRTNKSSHIMYVMVEPALVIALAIALVILIVFCLVLCLVCLIKKRKTCPPQDQRDDVGQQTATDNPDRDRMQYVSTISSSLLTESQEQDRLLSRNCGYQNSTIVGDEVTNRTRNHHQYDVPYIHVQ